MDSGVCLIYSCFSGQIGSVSGRLFGYHSRLYDIEESNNMPRQSANLCRIIAQITYSLIG